MLLTQRIPASIREQFKKIHQQFAEKIIEKVSGTTIEGPESDTHTTNVSPRQRVPASICEQFKQIHKHLLAKIREKASTAVIEAPESVKEEVAKLFDSVERRKLGHQSSEDYFLECKRNASGKECVPRTWTELERDTNDKPDAKEMGQSQMSSKEWFAGLKKQIRKLEGNHRRGGRKPASCKHDVMGSLECVVTMADGLKIKHIISPQSENVLRNMRLDPFSPYLQFPACMKSERGDYKCWLITSQKLADATYTQSGISRECAEMKHEQEIQVADYFRSMMVMQQHNLRLEPARGMFLRRSTSYKVSVDPVGIWVALLVSFLLMVPAMRRVCEKVKVWCSEYPFTERISQSWGAMRSFGQKAYTAGAEVDVWLLAKHRAVFEWIPVCVRQMIMSVQGLSEMKPIGEKDGEDEEFEVIEKEDAKDEKVAVPKETAMFNPRDYALYVVFGVVCGVFLGALLMEWYVRRNFGI